MNAPPLDRLIQPEDLKRPERLMWSPGLGTDVWEMFGASMSGDVETVKRLVEKDPSLVRAHYEYRTPLSFAVRENQLEVAAYLLDLGAASAGLGNPLEMARDRGYTEMEALLERKLAERHGASAAGEPLAAAIRDGDIDVVRRLLDESPDRLRAGDLRSNQPIHWAVVTRQLDMIDELLARGANINATRADGARPIHLTNGDYHYRGWRDVPESVQATPDDVFAHLVTRGAEVDLGMAAYKGDFGRVRQLLARDPSLANRVAEYNSYYIGCGAPLKNAVASGNREMVELLLAYGADPNLPEEGIAPRGHALYTAVARGHQEIAQLLLAHGADPNPPVESSADAVWIAIRNGDRGMLELLAANGAEMDVAIRLDGKLTYDDLVASGVGMPLKVLAFYGDVGRATALLDMDPALADDPEALEAAAGQGHEEFVRLLLRHRPDLAARVTVSKPRSMAELLFEHGMDPNRPNWLRITPLHRFAREGDVESASLFLKHGADVHVRDEEHQSTPLAWAAKSGRKRMAAFLLRHGASPDLPDDPPWATPLEWARRRGHADIVRMLTEAKRKGAPPPTDAAALEQLARDLVAAYDVGDEAAFHRLIGHFQIQRQLAWDRPPADVRLERLRRMVMERLGRPADAGVAATLPLSDARLLVARSEGVGSWEELNDGAPSPE